MRFERDTGKDGSIDTSASYTYDSNGQRTRSVVARGGVTTTTSWLYEGLALLRAQSVSEGATTTVECATDSAGRAFGAWATVPEREGSVWVWLVTNQRGDVLELLASDGTPISHRACSAYGETFGGASRAGGGLTGGEASAIDSAVTLRYAGYTHDSESGLYYCSQRYYDPVSCQWITKDPARADGEESAYQYCGGDPVGGVDPTGLRAGRPLYFYYLWKADEGGLRAVRYQVRWKAVVGWGRSHYRVKVSVRFPQVALFSAGGEALLWVNHKAGGDYGRAVWNDYGRRRAGLGRSARSGRISGRRGGTRYTYLKGHVGPHSRVEAIAVHAALVPLSINTYASDWSLQGAATGRNSHQKIYFSNPKGKKRSRGKNTSSITFYRGSVER